MSLLNIGNKNIEETVKKIIESHRIPHAFIIEGNEGSGRHGLANHLAAACVCEDENGPCGKCKQCALLSAGTHLDVITVKPEKDKKNISVAQIRDARASAFIKPTLSQKKVFIIDDAHKMNEQAQNALLKVLEEPPTSVVFILIVPSRTLLLPTVISRCTLFSLQNNAFSKKEAAMFEASQNFIKFLFEQKDYEMLKILQKYEKSRASAEDFFMQLKLACVDALKENYNIKTNARTLDELYRQADEYIKLLKTNINLSLLFTAAVSRAIRLTK